MAAVTNFSALVLILFLLAATWTDLHEYRITNKLAVCCAMAGCGWQIAFSGFDIGLKSVTAGAMLGFAAFLPLYLLSAMGAGDVKLMAAVGTFLGPDTTLIAVAATLIAGGIIACGLLVWRRVARQKLPGHDRGKRQRMPYAGAILAGSLYALWVSAVVPGTVG